MLVKEIEDLVQKKGGQYLADAEGHAVALFDVNDNDLAALQLDPLLTQIDIYSTSFSDEGLRNLSSLPRLESLDLNGSAISGQGLQHVPPDALVKLSLCKCKCLRDEELSTLVHLKNLEILFLDETSISDAAMVHVGTLHNLRGLYVSDTGLTDAGLRYLATCSCLEGLVAMRGVEFTIEGMEWLRSRVPLRRQTRL